MDSILPETLTIKEGLTENQIAALIHFSNTDLLILDQTSDLERFGDRNSFNEWLSKGRTIYTLLDDSDELLGIIWFGPKSLPENKNYLENLDKSKFNMTFAIRLYEKARGRHLSRPFTNIALKKFRKKVNFDNLWLETKEDNLAASSAYEKMGWRRVSEPDEENKVIYVKEF
jgi:ribosomal protein S18 acetylase RimI-like enzyme